MGDCEMVSRVMDSFGVAGRRKGYRLEEGPPDFRLMDLFSLTFFLFFSALVDGVRL